MTQVGSISGCDFVGEVIELGSEVPPDQVKKGEIRWGFVRGGADPHRGAFAELVIAGSRQLCILMSIFFP